MNNIFAVIITFNPQIEILKQNIASVANQVDQLIIVDNGSDNLEEITQQVLTFKNATVSALGYNSGIAAATNFGIKKLGTVNSWCLILDQDSFFPKNGIAIYKKYLKLLKDYNVGMLVPEYIERNEELNISTNNHLPEWEFVDYPIASGSLVNYSAWKKINGYDENLFIDRVDDDFDLRMRLHSYQLIQVNSIHLDHAIGNIEVKRLFGKNIIVYNHNAFRKYYQARNNIIFAKKHRKIKDAFVREFNLIIKTVFFEDDKGSKLLSIFKGIVSGLTYKLKEESKV